MQKVQEVMNKITPANISIRRSGSRAPKG